MALRGSANRRRAGGMAAIEFAIVFPLLFAVVLGIVYYGMVLALQQVLTLAAEEGARAALRYPLTSNGGTLATTLAQRVVAADQAARSALPPNLASRFPAGSLAQALACTAPPGTQCVQVALNLSTQTILPAVPFVPVPASLTGTAVVQLSPDT
ncbi:MULTISPECIES: TadE/TadG family type IV pilus assembly protein [unclassified Cupriavidus]|uniref:TadE/TadG family type IV pilus assembly protein n=1 Tax=unclassified Cupriavidus TaxID=2640874 RepID=UPI001C000E2A|nr:MULTISPECIES: TadE/TadG family type IV pilus assembly protein [unclassified Cupriavidus]MCA3182277.1 pilus assembly protein [Cupriavidus sp.]MCA3191716.1 pilus assembly protein [Cupriavidus sp.]MCA3197946.1 pilus assembly protein [Cupriavidus sp.]MCA3200630.1 pilus assembly protein [Cupriavidus sp.]MCA3207481.1 pilus assembly protein [Cupriavidus sp.]